VTPWVALVAALLPYYPEDDGRGRPPVGLERMLRMYIAQQCFGLSEEGIEDAIYDSQAIRGFVGIDLTHESAPDATPLLKFRRLLETHNLTRRIFRRDQRPLGGQRFGDARGDDCRRQVDRGATIDGEPRQGARSGDAPIEEMQRLALWMKAHVGVDMATGLVHSVVGTAGNVNDVTQAHALLHGGERVVLGDAGYQGVSKRPENADKAIDWHTAMRPSVRKALKKNRLGRVKEKLEQTKASVRAKVEHCFHIVKCLFKHRKTRYRGLAKNNAQLFTLFGIANLVLAPGSSGGCTPKLRPECWKTPGLCTKRGCYRFPSCRFSAENLKFGVATTQTVIRTAATRFIQRFLSCRLRAGSSPSSSVREPSMGSGHVDGRQVGNVK
jgi:IS5 family transposase